LIEATGPGGRITSDDVERAASSQLDDPSPRTDYVEADGLRLFSIVAGPASGQRLVFLHGLSGSFSTWQVVMGELADRYRVAAIDLPGHGQSDKPEPETFDYAVPSLANNVAAALRNAKVVPAIVVGHSLGGSVALQLALGYPETVLGLVLVNSTGLGTEISPELLAQMDLEPGPETARSMLQLFFEDQALVLDRGVDEMAQGQLSEGGWKAQRATAASAFSSNAQSIGALNRLSEITIPTLIVWGAKDRVMPVDHAIHAAGVIPDATLKLLPAIGHVPQVEAAAAVSHAIDRFARSLSE
jgi:pyruvate dehydrogenase E2 component (dihydrolipoamide acetyltransferase)